MDFNIQNMPSMPNMQNMPSPQGNSMPMPNMNIMNMSTGGTPINALMNGPQQMPQMPQQDRRNYDKAALYESYLRSQEINKHNNNNIANNQMDKLAAAINQSLDDYVPPAREKTTQREEEHTEETEQDKDRSDEEEIKPKTSYTSYIPLWTREMILILILYILMSLGFIKNAIGSYIKYINPASDGNVPISGVIIYGLILSSLFILFRKLFLKA